jgi:hypothetical protein
MKMVSFFMLPADHVWQMPGQNVATSNINPALNIHALFLPVHNTQAQSPFRIHRR